MHFLASLRQDRLCVLLATLSFGERDHEEISGLDAQIRTDYHGRFLIELIQNAVDPALKAGTEGARVLIVRTPELLAVLNQGAPFNEAGVRSIVSLGLSPKKPDEAIGNKGVGFKSVFEVAHAAEIFGGTSRDDDLHSPGLRIRLTLTPALAQEGLLPAALALLEVDQTYAEGIAARHGDIEAAITAALGKIPGWRYPQELTPGAWSTRTAELGLDAGDLTAFHTAVVLHLRAETQCLVDHALRELLGGTREVHLFLPGLGTIEVRDAEGRARLERQDVIVDHAQSIAVRRLLTCTPGSPPQERLFWVATTTVTGSELEAAAQTLPGQGWADVKRADVQVALPFPDPDGVLPTDGRYFIGLPSKDETGSPFRVDARFHATLSRTALDRVGNPFNALLDRAASGLAAALLRRLRDAGNDDPLLVHTAVARRAVTLALARGSRGGFADSVRRHVHGEPIVLRDDRRFATVSTARSVEEADAAIVQLLFERPGRDALHSAGIHLADPSLSEALLADLGVPLLRPEELLTRSPDASVIERLAATLPRSEGTNWRALLHWCAGRLPAAGDDQLLLPTVDDLVPPSSRPFVPLLASPANGELSASDVPLHLLRDLVCLDGDLVRADSELRRALIEGERPLARRPSALALLAGAVLPALAAASAAGEDARSREHLALGLRLLRHVGSAENVGALDWLVPCDGGWKGASDAYLGDAWRPARGGEDEGAEPTEGLVQRVYGREGRCVIAWWGMESERDAMRTALIKIGVADSPRVRAYETVPHVIWGDFHAAHLTGGRRPEPIPHALWTAWLQQVVATEPSVDWGPRTWWNLEGVEWIDGLDRLDVAAELAAWALGRKEFERARLVPVPERPSRWRPDVRVAQPWMFLLHHLDVPFVPTHPKCAHAGAPARPLEICRVPSERNIVPWLPRVAERLNAELLAYVGVRSLSDMPISWLIEQLSAFAGALEPARQNSILARGLWTLVNTRARTEELPHLHELLLPVWKDGEVVAVRAGALGSLLVIDDAYKAEILGDALDGASVLEPEEEDWRPLASRLCKALPEVSVRLVTELPVPWKPDPAVETLSLIAFLASSAGHRAVGVLAAIVRATRTGVGEKDMQRAWGALREARVQATLGPSDPRAVWLAEHRILLAQDLEPSSLVAEVWPAMGPAWRDDLLALGEALRRGDRGLRDLVRHKRLRDEAIEEAVARCGLAALVESFRDGIEMTPPPRRTGTAAFGGEGTVSWVDQEDEGDSVDLVGARRGVEDATIPERLPVEAPRPQRQPHIPKPDARDSRGRVGGRAGPSRSDAAAREIGHLGELFAFRVLSTRLPGFDESCWVSTSRALRDLEGGDDTLGYDFHYLDRDGVLTGRSGVECFIEVKSNGGEMRQRFSLSANEWRLAEVCSGSADQAFVIVRVHGVVSDPKLGPVLVDPVALARDGTIRLSPKDGWWVET